MELLNFLSSLYKRRFLSIDPSSKSLAFAIIDRSTSSITLVATGKILFATANDFSDKCHIINASIEGLVEKYNPSSVLIEEAIYLQNPNTTRVIAYIVGATWAAGVRNGCSVSDVGPLKWKAGIGYKRVTKKDIAQWTSETTHTEAKKRAASERKSRVKDIVLQHVPDLDESDLDIVDAIAIGIWGVLKYETV